MNYQTFVKEYRMADNEQLVKALNEFKEYIKDIRDEFDIDDFEEAEMDYELFCAFYGDASYEDIITALEDYPEIAEELQVDDFPAITDRISTIRDSIEVYFNTTTTADYEYNPSEEGGIYTLSLILNDPDLGFLGEFLILTVVAEIRIDFRPSCYEYVGVHILENAYSSKRENLLGDCRYIHFEISEDGGLVNPSLESM